MGNNTKSQTPTVFLSHVHTDRDIASSLENIINQALSGGVDVFNSSNRKSIALGDPWRDVIVKRLRKSDAVLVIATPESVARPWVNFETGGAWVSGRRVIPCCAKGMVSSSLPSPLHELQGINLATADDLRSLIGRIAEVTRLNPQADFDYDHGVEEIKSASSESFISIPRMLGPDFGDEAVKAFRAGGDASRIAGTWMVDWFRCDENGEPKAYEVKSPTDPSRMVPYPSEKIEVSANGSLVFCTAWKPIGLVEKETVYWLAGRVSHNNEISLLWWNAQNFMNGSVFLETDEHFLGRLETKLQGWWAGSAWDGKAIHGTVVWRRPEGDESHRD